MVKKKKGSKNENHVELGKCDSLDTWDYSPRTALLKHVQTDLCLKVTRTPLKLWLVKCSSQDTQQKWYFTKFDEEGLFMEHRDHVEL